jgi:hypothetical protein
MATGSGTGTPASGAGASSLSSLRARVMTQVTAAMQGINHEWVTASGATLTTLRERVRVVLQQAGRSAPAGESEVGTASSLTLTTLRDRVELVLQDTGNAIWATGDLDEAITQTLEAYSRARPASAIGTITLSADGREIDISSLTGLLRVEKVWCPYDSTSPSYPPDWRSFSVWPGNILFIDDSDEPLNGEKVRIWYTKEHTLDGLDGETATTIPVDDEAFFVQGCAAFAARFRAIEIAEQANVDDKVFDRLTAWAREAMETFRDGLERRRRVVGGGDYDQDALDEAIRQALDMHSRIEPDTAITTLTLGSSGREIDISSVTGLIRVMRVWWDYDSSSPGYPPNWRHFQVWPGKLLYIDDTSEPSSGEHVRLWYAKRHTLNGLDSATSTTFAVEDESYIVMGAAGMAARALAARKAAAGAGGARTLMDWANGMVKEARRGMYRGRRNYVFDYDQDDVDEAIRWALARYSEVNPEVVITTVTLSSAGREVDISSITDYEHVTRVWVDYDSSDPEYPPRWRDFEVWPGDILFVDDAQGEPDSGDVIRVWYTRKRTLTGLDGASATSLPDMDDTLVVVGAAGFVAQERVQEEDRRSVPRKLREWADARLAEFERGVEALARREAARHSGVAGMPALDRWDRGEGVW